MNGKRWNLLPRIPDQLLTRRQHDGPGLSPLMAQLAYNRGLAGPAELESFISAPESLVGDPFLLPDMTQAVARVYRALLSGEKIAIYGDFDADGITATAVLVRGLEALGGSTLPYLPSRVGEGHGLKARVLENLKHEGAGLVITVDCGITGAAEVRRASRLGLDVIITDHHTPPDEIPQAAAVVDPRLPDSEYPFADLAGVGVAFKLLQALLRSLGREEQAEDLMDLVALGTVADMMPLLGENRYMVKRGLQVLNENPRLGLRQMMARTGLGAGNIDAGSISWVIAPRLNTASRMDHALPSYELLMTDSEERAAELAAWLEKKNAERQQLTGEAVSRAREWVLERGIAPILLIGDEAYAAGIAGLVAGRLADEFYRPAVVVHVGKRSSSGSCRSIPEFNIINALSRCSDLFSQFGGHAQAAGFVMPTRNLARLGDRLQEIAGAELAGVDLRARIDVEAETTLTELTGDTFQALQQLAPFGQGNPEPVFLTRRVEVVDCRKMGNDGSHLRFKLRQDGIVWDAVGFGLGEHLPATSTRIDIVYSIEIDHWGGRETLRLNVTDFAEAGAPAPA